MALTVGSRLGHYDVTALIGEGGMGQVYQATDTKLNRQVALKILPEAFATDPDRLARFQREAQVLASLNHPGIAAIYGLEESGNTRALVLELVEGPTLADRIAQGAIPLDEALPIAKQIAEALEAAHEAGVIHRDLKPANIKVRDDGTVKVLDFGVAKALDTSPQGDPSQSPTLTAAATQMGVILGTAAYMSPEQARGKPVDRRADIWAFGVVVYEMLTGARPFQGEDVSLTLASVMKSDVDVQTLPPGLPETLRTVLRRCLEKDPLQRIRDMGDVRLAMDGAFETTLTKPSEPMGVPAAPQSKLPWIAATALVAAVTGLAVWGLTARAPNETPTLSRFTIEMPPEAPVVTNYRSRVVTISPDGSRVAYASALGGDRTIYVRPVDELQAIELRGTEGSGTAPFFSPDGEFIGFAGESDGQTLKRVPALGGTPVTIASLDSQPFGMEWATDDTILFSAGPRRGLLRIPAVGGEVEELTTVDVGEAWHEHATLLPDGDTILFTISYRSGEEPQLARLSLRSREVTRLPLNGSDPIYSPTGHIVYVVSDGTLRAVGFDLDRLELTSTNPVPVLENVNTGFGRRTGNFGLAANGSLVYLSGDSQAAQRTLVWVDREGREELIGAEPGDHRGLRLAPDGERAALVMRDGDGNVDVLIYDLARDISTRFTFDPANDSYPVWSPDGERVVFGSTREGISSLFWKAADGSGEAERLTTSTRNEFSGSWSSDGTTLVYTERSPETGLDIVVLAVDDERVSETLIETEFSDTFPNISPDGRWLVYASNESGQFEIYVRPFPNVSTGKWQVSRGGGLKPLWAPDGRELFYRRPDDLAMMVAPIETEPTFSPGNPTVLFEATNFPVPAGPRRFDIAPDGQRFLMTKEGEATSEDATPPQINIVLNWREELKRLVPVP